MMQPLATRTHHGDERTNERLLSGHFCILECQLTNLAALTTVENATELFEFNEVVRRALL